MKNRNKLCIFMIMLCFVNTLNATDLSLEQQQKSEKPLIDKKRDAEILQLLDQLDKQLDKLPKESVQHQQGLIQPPSKMKEPIELLDQELLLEDNLDALELEKTLSSEFELMDELTVENDPLDMTKKPATKQLKPHNTSLDNMVTKEENIINTLDGSNLLNIDKELEQLDKKFQLKSKVKGPRIDEQ